MKISVCVYGDISNVSSTYKSCEDLFLKFKNYNDIVNNDYYVDYFLHAWDFNKITKNKLNEDKINDFLSLINPKQIIIEDIKKFNTRSLLIQHKKYDHPDYCDNINLLTKNEIEQELYSISCVANLKKKHEIIHNIQYDVCFLLNAESEFTEIDREIIFENFEIPKRKHVVVGYTKNIDYYPYIFCDTNLIYAESETFDVITKLYDFLPFIKNSVFDPNKDIKIGHVFSYFLRMLDVKIKRLNVNITNNQKNQKKLI